MTKIKNTNVRGKINIVEYPDALQCVNGISSKESIEEYLKNTYGAKRLLESKTDREFTHLDVVGFTLGKRGQETADSSKGYKDCYELDEIEGMMAEKWNKVDGVGSEDDYELHL